LPPLLELESVSAGYGEAVILDGVSLELAENGALAVLGRNGVGKTTLINTIMGQTRVHGGRLALAGRDMTRLASEKRARLGLGWVPQERNIFRSLSVEENLTAVARPGAWDVARIWRMFPRLQERRKNAGSQLSGGEQQMLAIGRALVVNPRLLLLDEPFEGLAPIIVEELSAALEKIVSDEGVATIIVEQNARRVLAMTGAAIVLDRGRIVHAGESAELRDDTAALDSFLGVTKR
jgi:branched-chain amino acid transport system ATP-binding protein